MPRYHVLLIMSVHYRHPTCIVGNCWLRTRRRAAGTRLRLYDDATHCVVALTTCCSTVLLLLHTLSNCVTLVVSSMWVCWVVTQEVCCFESWLCETEGIILSQMWGIYHSITCVSNTYAMCYGYLFLQQRLLHHRTDIRIISIVQFWNKPNRV